MLFSRLYLTLFFILSITTTSLIDAQEQQKPQLIQALLPKIPTIENNDITNISSDIIEKIEITGNITIPTTKILEKLTIKTGEIFNKIKLDRNIKRIKSIGTFENISYSLINSPSGKTIEINLTEYPLITSIQFKGNSIFTDNYLTESISSQKNEPYNIAKIKKDIIKIESIYKKAGYFNAKITNVSGPKQETGPATFQIAEGIIEDIVISGNRRTKDYVILREMDIRPGDVLNENELRKNIRQVFNLQYFENIEPQIIPGKTPYEYILKLDLTERDSQGSFAMGGGFSPNVGFNLFSDLYWDNLMGTGKMIMLKGNFGIGTSNYDNKNSTYQFRYTDPWAFGNRRSLSLRAWLTQGSLSSYSPLSSSYGYRDEYRKGFDAAIGIPHTYDFRTSHKGKYEYVELEDTGSIYRILSYTLGISYDKRDVKLNTRSGYYLGFNIEKSLPFTASALEYTQYDATLKKFLPTFKQQTIATQLRLGYITSPELDNEDIFTAQLYYVGGSRTVRGYDDNNPFGKGNKQVIASIEYRFLISTNLFFYFFADAGYAAQMKDKDGNFITTNYYDLSKYKVGKGIGVNFIIPGLGPIKLDLGIDDEKSARIQFNMGYTF